MSRGRGHSTPDKPSNEEVWAALVKGGKDSAKSESESRQQILELYKIMVASSEALVGRRQGVNTFFLTANGALLTGMGLVIQNHGNPRLTALAVLALAVTGGILAFAWRSLLISFGQLNTGKFAVINRLEELLPAAIYTAEWTALAEGHNPEIYRSFTSREQWAPNASLGIYGVVIIVAGLVAAGVLSP